MVTENNNAIWEEQVLASDLWSVAKSLTPMSDEEQLAAWKQAVSVLHDFGKLAETLHNDALLLACTDAMTRATEELVRVEDRLSRPEGENLHPRERERLLEMIERCDALSNAHWLVSANSLASGYVGVIEEMKEEADESLDRYRAECGLED